MLIFEDEHIIAINKPNNILVHHSKMANNLTNEKSLVELLRSKYNEKFYPIHRLDRKTSGVLLFSKQKDIIPRFQELFIKNNIQKTYNGIIRGFSPTPLTINSDVKGRDSNVYKNALTKLTTVATKELEIPVTPYDTSRYSLVELKPKTGRLHQLRIHLNKINHPLIGDPKYGDRFHNRMFIKEFNCDKMFLHARKIEFIHPLTDKKISIIAGYPKDWITIFDLFGWNV